MGNKRLSFRGIYHHHEKLNHATILLCDAINSVKGLKVSSVNIPQIDYAESENNEIRIFLEFETQKALFFLSRCISRRYWTHGSEWWITLPDCSDTEAKPHVMLKSYTKEAYVQAISLVENMNHHLNHVNFRNTFGFTDDDFHFVEYMIEKL